MISPKIVDITVPEEAEPPRPDESAKPDLLGIMNSSSNNGLGNSDQEEDDKESGEEISSPRPSEYDPAAQAKVEFLRRKLKRLNSEENADSLPIEEMLVDMGYVLSGSFYNNQLWEEAVAECKEMQSRHVIPVLGIRQNTKRQVAAPRKAKFLPRKKEERAVEKPKVQNAKEKKPKLPEPKEPAVDFLVASQRYIEQTDPEIIWRRNLLVQFLTPSYELPAEKQDEVLECVRQNGVKSSLKTLVFDVEVFKNAFLFLTGNTKAKDKFYILLNRSKNPKFDGLRCLLADGYIRWEDLPKIEEGGG
jgi:hypothetical protein